ncbi:MAG: S-layer family protein [Cyanobacteria bacterium P01_D01_bin.56]
MGNAGTVTIRAGEIDLVGRSRTGPLVSSISSQSTTEADAGSVNLSADRISIRENAEISVSSLAGGDAGSITVSTEDLFLDNGILEARVMAGTQGDIDVDAKRLLLMRRGSRIATDAIGMATGGNIRLTVPVLVGLENSDIVANAVNGDGGSVGITTQGILGFALRNQLTLNSDITASSEFGINGTVEINSFGTNFDANLVKLQTELFDASDQVVQGCGAEGRSEFVVTGRGGVPIPPNTPLRVESTWSDTRDMSQFSNDVRLFDALVSKPDRLAEAMTWRTNAAGNVELIALHFQDSGLPQMSCL